MTNISTNVPYMMQDSHNWLFPTANAGVTGLLRGSQEDALEKGMATISITVPEIMDREPGGLCSMDLQNWALQQLNQLTKKCKQPNNNMS